MIFISAGSMTQSNTTKDVLILSLAELSNEIVTGFNPDAVVFSLFGLNDDATLVVARLGEIGFRGKCIVLAPPLPRLELIKAELTSISPALTLELITLDRG